MLTTRLNWGRDAYHKQKNINAKNLYRAENDKKMFN